MAGLVSAIPLAPLGTVVCDSDADWESAVFSSSGYRGGAFELAVIGVAPNTSLDATIRISNDGVNWTNSASSWSGITGPGVNVIWPSDLMAFYKISYHLMNTLGPGNIGAITFGITVNLKDT